MLISLFKISIYFLLLSLPIGVYIICGRISHSYLASSRSNFFFARSFSLALFSGERCEKSYLLYFFNTSDTGTGSLSHMKVVADWSWDSKTENYYRSQNVIGIKKFEI